MKASGCLAGFQQIQFFHLQCSMRLPKSIHCITFLASFDLFFIHPHPPPTHLFTVQLSFQKNKLKCFNSGQKWILNLFLERTLKLFGSILHSSLPHSQPFNVCSQQVRTVQGRNRQKISSFSLNGSSASIQSSLASGEIYLGHFHLFGCSISIKLLQRNTITTRNSLQGNL